MGSSPLSNVLILFVPVVGTIALFAFLAIASWSRARQREREAFYRSELLRKLVDTPAEAAAPILSILREDEVKQLRRRHEGLFLAGTIWLVVGVGVIAMGNLIPDMRNGQWAVGIIPMFIGAAILSHATFLAARARSGGTGGVPPKV